MNCEKKLKNLEKKYNTDAPQKQLLLLLLFLFCGFFVHKLTNYVNKKNISITSTHIYWKFQNNNNKKKKNVSDNDNDEENVLLYMFI